MPPGKGSSEGLVPISDWVVQLAAETKTSWACPAVILLLEGCLWGGILPCLLLLCSPGQLCESGHVFWALQTRQRMSGGLGKPQSWAQTPSLGQGQHLSV